MRDRQTDRHAEKEIGTGTLDWLSISTHRLPASHPEPVDSEP